MAFSLMKSDPSMKWSEAVPAAEQTEKPVTEASAAADDIEE